METSPILAPVPPTVSSPMMVGGSTTATNGNNDGSESPDRVVETIRGQLFEVGPRYIDLTYIGEGAYGMVV